MVRNWGINDADYVVQSVSEDGKRDVCPIYQCWRNMIKRCYYPKIQVRYPTYIGCQVDERWRSFMTFREWYLEQDSKPGDHLDKDFLGDGKLYSPETCCLIPGWLNMLFTNRGAKRGDWPQGVSSNKRDPKYYAHIRCKGKTIHVGYFDTPEEASAAYLEVKATYVEELLVEFPQPLRVAAGVRRKMTELIEFERNVRHEPANR